MPSNQTLTSTTASDGGANEWTIPASPWSTSNQIFDNAMGSAATTATLTFTGFGHGSLPGTATVVGVELDGGFWGQTASTDFAGTVTVTVGSKTSGNCASSNVLGTTTGGTLSFGGSASFPGSMTAPSVTDVNTGSIQATWQFTGPGGGAGMSEIFSSGCSITIYYNTANQVIPQPYVVRAAYVRRD